jgi:hypothetical protein
MPSSFRCLVVALASLAGLVSCISIVSHDEQMAAKVATSFAQAAFVDRNDAKAHELLNASTQARFDVKAFGEMIAKMHPQSFPSQVVATDFESIPGQQALFIDVEGQGQGEPFFYRFVLDGDAKVGYKIADFVRSGEANPSKNKQSLIFRPGQEHSEGDGHQH